MNKLQIPLLLMLLLLGGCVDRSLEIHSTPEGAKVYLDNKFIGTTPLVIPFTYYGNHSILIEKEGYISLIGTVKLRSPWYEKPGMDFVSENVLPVTVYDRYNATFTLIEAERVDADQAIERAGNFADGFPKFRDKAAGDKQED